MTSAEEQTLYRMLAEITSDYAYACRIDPNGEMTPEWVSESFTQVTGCALADMTAQGRQMLIHPDERMRAAATDARLRAGEEVTWEFRTIARNGEMRWVRERSRPVWDQAQNRVVLLIGAGWDITARKETEWELAEAFARETLINRIGQVIRSVQNPDAVLIVAVEALGQALGADQCYYVTYDLEQGQEVVQPDWHRAGLESIAGVYDFSIFKFNHDLSYLAGQTHVVEDIRAFPGDAPPACTDTAFTGARATGPRTEDDRAGRRHVGWAAPLDS